MESAAPTVEEAGTKGITLAETAYEKMRAAILTGQFPPMSKLRAEHLSAVYGIGASPIREALARLAGDKFAVVEGHRGYWVAPISAADFEDITRTRILIECEAIERSIANGDLDWEGRIVAAQHRLSRVETQFSDEPKNLAGEWERENRSFHFELISNCGSEWLLRLSLNLYDHSERYRRISTAKRFVPLQRLRHEHNELAKACLNRDTKTARRVLTVHIQNTADSVVKHLKK